MGRRLPIALLLSSLIANTVSFMEIAQQRKNRCDENTVVTTKTKCRSCPLNFQIQCPEGYTKITSGFGIHDCRYSFESRTVSLPGCRHACMRELVQPHCCPGYWGQECLECPGGATSPCNNRGHCSQGVLGNGTCTCQKGFSGAACEKCADDYLLGPNCTSAINPCSSALCDLHADCLYLAPSCHKCVCQHGYEGDGQVCRPINPCQTKFGNCPEDSTVCKYDAPGKSHCECKEHFSNFVPGLGCRQKDICVTDNPCHKYAVCTETALGQTLCVCKNGYEGDGMVCSEIDPCANLNAHGCSANADCIKTGPGTHECVCQQGWAGNGRNCSEINNCLLSDFGGCHTNATCLYIGPGQNDCKCKEGFQGNGFECDPSNSCLEENWKCHPLISKQNVDKDTNTFSTSENNILSLIKHHIFDGMFSVEDLQNLLLSKRNGNLSADTANIISGDNAATNEIMYIIDKVLVPLRGESGALPRLLSRLEQMPDYSIFRSYIIHYNLAGEIEAASTYSIFAPSNDAIESYLKNKQQTSLDEEQIRYHIILGEKLLKNDLHNGMFRKTMLGVSFRVGFFVHDAQLYINEAPINYPNVATDKGIIHGLGRVMDIEKNRCDINDTVIINGKCLSCSYTPHCPPGSKLILARKICYYLHYYGRTLRVGCQSKCAKPIITRECCAGFYGPQCEPCPGLAGNMCFGNGICLDGINGTGSCECETGFQGVACDRCIEGKYGINCDQECACVHGKCNSGLKGDGTCECDVGWRGVKCDSEIKDDECNSTCHTSANCFLNPIGPAYCKCSAGFEGNGTYCSAINACESNNGDCSVKAECRRTTPGNRVCVCRAGYTGDGIVCIEVNPCLKDNGGCDKNAECIHAGPNQATCNCFKGYSGDGKSCTYISPCALNNGGCGENAICNDTLQPERTCTCKPNYIGDGFICRGSIFMELSKELNTTRFNGLLMDAGVRDISGTGPFTVFAPTNEALLAELKVPGWTSKGVMSQILRYHIISCGGLFYNDLTSEKTVITLQGDPLKVTFSQNEVFLNNKVKILTSDLISTNGVIHIIDKVLIPQRIQEFPPGQPKTMKENLKVTAAKNGYIMFYNLIESSGLINLINDPLHQPVTLFWPADKVIRALPKDQQDLLFQMSNKEKLLQYLKFHIIGGAKVLAYALPGSVSLKTLQGSDLSVKCGDDDTAIGELFLNERRCKITQRHLEFDGGIAYGIGCMLTDPVLGGRCDTFITSEFPGDCSNCYRITQCPAGSKVSGEKQSCEYTIGHRTLAGCRRSCSMLVRVPQCCKGYFGNKCQACPGGPEAPCNNHGYCDEGYAGTGECQCNNGFNGTSCELCLPGRFGFNCKSCECTARGQCDEGISGSGKCFCETGWTGQFCEKELVSVPVCSPSCSVNAVCNDDKTCECKPYYTGDGFTCTAENLCKKSNGGCHMNAKCTQTGVKISCSCQKGYRGDGYTCTAINPCTDGLNGGCHEHAVCTMKGPDKRKCECQDNYIGDGIDCEVKQLPVDRCLEENGYCHADANCTDLHFQDSTVGVFHIRSAKGQYKLTYGDANKTCADEGATVATYNQLLYAQKAKYHLCAAGWLANGRVAYPTAFSSPKCGGGIVGIVDYGIRVNQSETWDVFCYRVKDVNCTCKTGYVGDGFTCSGNLLQVLFSFPTFSDFRSEIFEYSNASRKGQEFVKYLSNLSIKATLFVPNNDGLKKNETLSARDIEYHLSINDTYYEDLSNGTILQTRIGERLIITHQDQISLKKRMKTKYVNGRAIREWDIVASNGVIHVLEAPLKAPPVPSASLHPAAGMGIFFAVILVIGIIALVGYSYIRFKYRTIRFQLFREKDDTDATTLDKAPSSNISNPNYESSSAPPPAPPHDPYLVSDEQQLVSSDSPNEV